MTIRGLPGLHWLRIHLRIRRARRPEHVDPRVWGPELVQPGHAWLYRGLVRRDTFTIRGRGVVVMFMPKADTFRSDP